MRPTIRSDLIVWLHLQMDGPTPCRTTRTEQAPGVVARVTCFSKRGRRLDTDGQGFLLAAVTVGEPPSLGTVRHHQSCNPPLSDSFANALPGPIFRISRSVSAMLVHPPLHRIVTNRYTNEIVHIPTHRLGPPRTTIGKQLTDVAPFSDKTGLVWTCKRCRKQDSNL
jgi:hypothetical protein